MLTRALVLTALLLPGCHARFKKHAPHLENIRAQVLIQGGPSVNLGHVEPPPPPEGHAPDPVAVAATTAANMASDIEAARIAARLARVIQPEVLGDRLTGGIATTLGDGPPFAYKRGEGPAGARLEVVVTDFGIDAESGRPALHFQLSERIFRHGDGKKVYVNSMTCTTAQGSGWGAWGELAEVVAAIAWIESLTDDELRDTLLAAAERCGQEVVFAMRRHAS